MKINIVTIFDKNYLVRAVAFYNALAKLGDYNYWFLCVDDETKEVMAELALPDVNLITIDEMGDNELLATKHNRNRVEFVFTAKSAFANFIAQKLSDDDAMIFLDNDVIFFLSPDKLIHKMKQGGYSIGINPHRFPKEKDWMNGRVGRYNAGFMIFILDQNARQCISDWRKDCIDWCYLKYEEERFGDQKYIEKWQKRYNGVYEILDKGVNVASWNMSNWKISKRGDQFYIDDEPLICYHFPRLKFYVEKNRIKP